MGDIDSRYWNNQQKLSESTKSQIEFMVNEFLTSTEKWNPEQANQRELFSSYIQGLNNHEKTEVIKYLDEKFFMESNPRKKNGILQLKNDIKEQSTMHSSKETNNNIPFNVVSGYCDIDTIGGFADGRYSVINVFWPASTQSTPHYNDEKFLQEGFQRYDLHLKMDRKRNYFTTKPIYIRFESNMTRLDLGFEGKIYSVIIPRDSVIREGIVTSLPKGGSIYRESTTISRQMTIDIWSTNAKLHLVIDVGVIR